ncbi:MAG TPA: ribonuclease Z [Gemmatimonadaceae bacterium]|nr:ribonuclease Z [Gemmatimonadaceae bacterium]
MSLAVRILGTSAARPTVERGVSSIAVIREGETLLFDCGEGTQRQMMRYGISFALNDIFFTHFHGDHVIGVVGLFRTLALQGRETAMRLWGPRGASRILRSATHFGVDRVGFPLEITELEPGQRVARDGYEIVASPADHRGAAAFGYALVEQERRGRFNPDLARELGVPEGPLWGQIHRGMAVTLPDGRVIQPQAIVGPTRPGRTLVLSGDTRPTDTTVSLARHADLLVHEATFGDEEAARATETGHSTAREAAQVARSAGARRLVLTHFSARYSRDAQELVRQARELFPETVAARDGMEIEIPYAADNAADSAADGGPGGAVDSAPGGAPPSGAPSRSESSPTR